MTGKIIPLKNYKENQYLDIVDKNITQSEDIKSGIEIVALKGTTNQDIAELIYHLNTLSTEKGYGELSVGSVKEDIKSTVISIIGISEDQLIEIMNIEEKTI